MYGAKSLISMVGAFRLCLSEAALFDWNLVTISGVARRLSSWAFVNAYRANVGHCALFCGLVVYNQLKSLARPRGIEPLFSP